MRFRPALFVVDNYTDHSLLALDSHRSLLRRLEGLQDGTAQGFVAVLCVRGLISLTLTAKW